MLENQKPNFSIFLVLKGLNKIKKILRSIQNLFCCAAPNTDLQSNRNISKTVTVKLFLIKLFLKAFKKHSNHKHFDRLCNCGSSYWCLKLLESQKSKFSIFLVLKGLKKSKQIKNPPKPPKLVRKLLFKQFQ